MDAAATPTTTSAVVPTSTEDRHGGPATVGGDTEMGAVPVVASRTFLLSSSMGSVKC